MWNQIEIKLIFKSHIYFIKHFDEQRSDKKSPFQDLKTNQREKITQTVWKHVTIYWFTKHHWDQRFRAVVEEMIAMNGEKNDVMKANTQSIQFLLKRWMRRNGQKNEKTTSNIHQFTKWKKLKNLFSHEWLQTEDHTQNKNFKISKNDWYECRE